MGPDQLFLFGPRGPPNLQGPLFQAVIGDLGWLLGGAGSDYLLANAIVSLTQWAAAVFTVGFFTLQLGGGWTAHLPANVVINFT